MFNLVEFGAEIAALRKGAYTQTDMIVVDLSSTFDDMHVDIPSGATMLALAPRLLDRNGMEQTSNVTGRVYIKFNSLAAPGLPFSLIASSGDLDLFAGGMVRLYITNRTIVAGAKLYFMIGIGTGIASASGGPTGGGYAPPLGGGTTSVSGSSSSSSPDITAGGGGGSTPTQYL